MKVYINAFPWHVSPANTDWRINWDIARLREQFAEMETFLPRHWLPGVEPNLGYTIRALLRRAGLHRFTHASWLNRMTMVNHVWPPEFKRFGADVVFANGTFPGNVGATPIVFNTGFDEPAEAGAAGLSDQAIARENQLKRVLARKAKVVTVSNEGAARRMAAAFPESAAKIRALPFFRPDLRPLSRQRVIGKHSESGPLRLLFVGLQSRRKGLETVLAAVEALHRQRPDSLHLDVVSDFRDGTVQVPTGLPVVQHGSLPFAEVERLLANAHVLVMLSRRESYGLVYIESMAHGCVTIAPDKAVQRELLADGAAGILLPPGQAGALATTLGSLIDNSSYRLQIAMAGYERYLACYDRGPVGKQFVAAMSAAVNS